MSHQVFISYSHIDNQIAYGLCFKLEEQGIKCWIAPRDIRPGANFASEIACAIPSCKVMLLILSKSSNSSPQVLRELELAANNRLVIIPVRIEEIIPTGGVSYYLAATQWIDIKGKEIDSKITLISKHIKDILGVVEESAPVAEESDSENVAFKAGSRAKTRKIKNENKEVSGLIKPLAMIVSSLFVLAAAVFFISNWRRLASDADKTIAEPSFSPSPVTSMDKVAQIVEDTSSDTQDDSEMSPDTRIDEFITDPILRDCIAGTIIAAGIDFENEGFTIGSFLNIEGLAFTTAHAEEVGSLGDVENYISANGYDFYKYIADGKFDNLDGLEYAKNLKCLIITEQSLSDISAIADLNELKVIYLQSTNITNAQPLYDKTKLKYLNIGETPIDNIAPLEHSQDSLEYLYMAGCENIQDYNVLSVLTKLQVLDLSNTNFKDLKTLLNLKNLTKLFLSETAVDDISLLLNLNLQELYIDQDLYDSNKIIVEQLNVIGCKVFIS